MIRGKHHAPPTRRKSWHASEPSEIGATLRNVTWIRPRDLRCVSNTEPRASGLVTDVIPGSPADNPSHHRVALRGIRIDALGSTAHPNALNVSARLHALHRPHHPARLTDNSGQPGGLADADMDAPQAWDAATASATIVAVIDSGVRYTHEDLAANMWRNPSEIPGNGIDDDGDGYIDDVLASMPSPIRHPIVGTLPLAWHAVLVRG